MIYIVYETFLFVANKHQNAPLDILGSNKFLGGTCLQTLLEFGLHNDSIQATPLVTHVKSEHFETRTKKWRNRKLFENDIL